MPVRKYRSVAELSGPLPLPPMNPDNLRLAFELMDLTCRLAPVPHVPGVRKFRSFDEAVAARTEREAEQARKARRERA